MLILENCRFCVSFISRVLFVLGAKRSDKKKCDTCWLLIFSSCHIFLRISQKSVCKPEFYVFFLLWAGCLRFKWTLWLLYSGENVTMAFTEVYIIKLSSQHQKYRKRTDNTGDFSSLCCYVCQVRFFYNLRVVVILESTKATKNRKKTNQKTKKRVGSCI